jgi:hypothetical protein
MKRQLSSWLKGFLEWTDGIVSPERFRTWTALSTVAGALGRQTWTRIQGQDLHPNMYVLMLGPPGIGKSNAAYHSHQIISEVKTIKLAPEGITKRSLIAELERSQTRADTGDPLAGMHAQLYASIEEFGVFVHPQDKDFMVTLARLYDCRPVFDYKTQHMGEHHIENACLNILGGTTPDYIKDAFSKEVLGSGFPARMILVFSNEKVQTDLFTADASSEEPPEKRKLREALINDLRAITGLQGSYAWAEDARDYLVEWYEGGMAPKPMDPRLEHYCTRRLAHVVKLCQIIAASKGEDMVISIDDLVVAKEVLIEAETWMPKVIEVLGENPLKQQMELAIRVVNLWWTKHHEPIPEYKLRQALYREVHPQWLGQVIQGIALAREVESLGDEDGKRVYWPTGAKKEN